jgi:hypothetical protein
MIFVRRKVRVTHLNVVEILERQRSLSALDRRRCDRGAVSPVCKRNSRTGWRILCPAGYDRPLISRPNRAGAPQRFSYRGGRAQPPESIGLSMLSIEDEAGGRSMCKEVPLAVGQSPFGSPDAPTASHDDPFSS